MRGNTFGKLFSITTFGESHGPSIGVIVDGVPPGLIVSLDDLKMELKKRAPGQLAGTTSRFEEDDPQIQSGVFEGKTLGTPICVIVANKSQRSQDYEHYKNHFRPGHADRTTLLKYGIRDHRGGGRSSGRETIARIIGAYFAQLVLPKLKVSAVVAEWGEPLSDTLKSPSLEWSKEISFGNYHALCSPNGSRDEEIKNSLEWLQKNGRSVGARIFLRAEHIPQGLGEPVFDKLKADLAKALMSVGGVVGVCAGRPGDFLLENPNDFHGIEGGMSNGDDLLWTIDVKPASTKGKMALEGRHDPAIFIRGISVYVAMIKLTIVDHYLRQKAYL